LVDINKARLLDGWMFEPDLEWLAIQASQHKKILELGAYRGRSTRALCDNTNGTVITVDNWNTEGIADEYDHDCFRNSLSDHLFSGKLIAYRQNTDDYLDYFINKGHKFDFIFIDAWHEYAQVKKDIEGCLKILEQGGMISGHDFNWPGVEQAVKELIPDYNLFNYIWYKEI